MVIRRRLMSLLVFVLIGTLVIIIAFSVYKSASAARADAIVHAVQESFPEFCAGADHHIWVDAVNKDVLTDISTLANAPSSANRYWGVRCDTDDRIFHGYAAIIDIQGCVAVRPVVGTLSRLATSYEIWFKFGQKMKSCPNPTP